MKTPQDMDKQMGVMQESMLQMHEQMHKVMDAKIHRSVCGLCKRTGK